MTTVVAAKAELYMLDLSSAEWMVAPDSDPEDRLEVAFLQNGAVALRHSSDPVGTVLIYTAAEWKAFVDGCRDGEFNADIERAEHQAAVVSA